MKKIAPSLLSANFGNLETDIKMVNESEADWFHLDIMDGVFVPNISFGFPVISAVKKLAKKPLDVHLMIVQPERYLENFKNVGAEILTVHYEACTHLHRTLHAIKSLEMKAGLAINPHTSVSLLENVLFDVDLILIMSVNPGFGGQKFIENTYTKIKQLQNLKIEKNLSFEIEIDGGVDIFNSKKLFETGATVLVAGNSVFKAQNPLEAISQMKN